MCGRKEVLGQGNYGYIAVCRGCGTLTLAFGTTMTVMSRAEMQFIHKRLLNDLEVNQDKVCPLEKSFMFRLGADRTCLLVLNYEEMQSLEDMIANALLMEEAHKLLKGERQ